MLSSRGTLVTEKWGVGEWLPCPPLYSTSQLKLPGPQGCQGLLGTGEGAPGLEGQKSGGRGLWRTVWTIGLGQALTVRAEGNHVAGSAGLVALRDLVSVQQEGCQH